MKRAGSGTSHVGAARGSDGPCLWAVGVDTSISAACPARPMFLAGFCFSGTPSGWVPGASVWGTPRTYIGCPDGTFRCFVPPSLAALQRRLRKTPERLI